MECVEIRYKTFVKKKTNTSTDTTNNEVIGVGSKICHAPSLCFEI
jgi:hypothetical protein